MNQQGIHGILAKDSAEDSLLKGTDPMTTFRTLIGLLFWTVFTTIFSVEALAEEHKIGMAGWEFNPVKLNIKTGDTVTWLNDDDTNHNIAFEIEFDSAPTLEKPIKVRATKEYSLVFNQAGTYHYVCKIHANYDMKGVIIAE